MQVAIPKNRYNNCVKNKKKNKILKKNKKRIVYGCILSSHLHGSFEYGLNQKIFLLHGKYWLKLFYLLPLEYNLTWKDGNFLTAETKKISTHQK